MSAIFRCMSFFVLGGVGLSGSPGKDDECVAVGMEKVADQLK